MPFRALREKVNLLIYNRKNEVLALGKWLNILVSLAAVAVMIIYYGFSHTDEDKELLLSIIKGSFAFYVTHYIVRIVFDFQLKEFLRRTWFEGLLMLFLVVEGIAYNFFGTLLVERFFNNLGISSFSDWSVALIQAYFFSVVIVELLRGGSNLPRLKLNPAVLFITSFALIIFSGTGLLMLPEMTNAEGSMNFLDALFTSTSATCVTGLMVEDTPSFFSFKGQVVLLVLIKLGGLNIIAFGSFIALVSRLGVGVKHHDVIEDFVNKDSAISAQGMLGKVILWASSLELIGAAYFYVMWGKDVYFESTGQKLFSSLFHSVSAFNNAGISLFSDGLYNEQIRENYFVHWGITILVFFGALGMVAIFDLFDPSKLRMRMRKPWMQISFPTKIALYFSIVLVVAGVIPYFILEYNNTLAGQSLFGKVTTSFFQSVTRTSGFNSVDIGAIGVPMLFLLIILMFIGSSSSSTGGGIKTSTLAIIVSDLKATLRGEKNANLFRRSISPTLISRAYSVLLYFLLGNLLCTFLLCITEHEILATQGRGILDLIFEQVSAMGTVGLSMGITADLSPAGKVIIMIAMLVGRVGTLTVAFAFGGKVLSKNYKYSEGHTMVG